MTPAQLATLQADILADPTLSAQPMNSDGAFAIAAAYNRPDATAVDAWRTTMSLDDVMAVMDWSVFIARSQGERDAFRLLLMTGAIRPSRPNVRAAFTDIFSGLTAPIVAQRAAFAAAAKRKMTRIERLLATGPTGGAFDLTFEGAVAYADVQAARA